MCHSALIPPVDVAVMVEEPKSRGWLLSVGHVGEFALST